MFDLSRFVGASIPSRTPGSGEREGVYVDARIQMRMLVALLVLEVVLAVGGIGYLYGRFREIIEANLYRIHQSSLGLFTQMVEETGRVVLVMVALNLLGLLIADRVWMWYVKRVLQAFTGLAARVADLDFADDSDNNPDQHITLALMLRWRDKERQRLIRIRSLVRRLDVRTPPEQLISHLNRLQSLLPPYSGRYVGRPSGEES